MSNTNGFVIPLVSILYQLHSHNIVNYAEPLMPSTNTCTIHRGLLGITKILAYPLDSSNKEHKFRMVLLGYDRDGLYEMPASLTWKDKDKEIYVL